MLSPGVWGGRRKDINIERGKYAECDSMRFAVCKLDSGGCEGGDNGLHAEAFTNHDVLAESSNFCQRKASRRGREHRRITLFASFYTLVLFR